MLEILDKAELLLHEINRTIKSLENFKDFDDSMLDYLPFWQDQKKLAEENVEKIKAKIAQENQNE